MNSRNMYVTNKMIQYKCLHVYRMASLFKPLFAQLRKFWLSLGLFCCDTQTECKHNVADTIDLIINVGSLIKHVQIIYQEC